MEEQPGLSEQYNTASPWPLFVALGIVLGEVGVFMGGVLLPVGVGGILLLEGSVVGIMRESGYAERLWTTSLGVGAVFGVVGVVLLLVATPGGQFHIYRRGIALTGAGGLAVLAAVGFYLYENDYL